MCRNFSKSFTIIEILVTVSIILIMSGAILAQYNNFTSVKRISEETNKLYDVIDLAKKKASAGDISGPDGTPLSCNVFHGYQLSLNMPASGQHSYVLSVCCNNSPMVCTDIFRNTVRTGIKLTSASNTWLFPPLTASNQEIKITLTDASGSNLKRCIFVNRGGLVTITNDVCP